MKWYQKKWVIILFLLFFFPVGLFLLWKYGNFKKRTKTILAVVFAFIFLGALASPQGQEPQTTANVQQKEEPQQKELKSEADTPTIVEEPTETVKEPETIEKTIPEPNTSEMVDYIALTAKENAQTITEEQKTEAMQFLKDNYTNYYANNETMEKVMYYGCLLEYAYKDIDDSIFNLGQDANQAVKYVYRGTETVDDTATQENLKQVKQSLDVIFVDPEVFVEPEQTVKPEPVIEVPPAQPQVAMVWIPTNGGTKYHRHSSCSGMNNPSQVTIDEAQSRGFTPCKRCY